MSLVPSSVSFWWDELSKMAAAHVCISLLSPSCLLPFGSSWRSDSEAWCAAVHGVAKSRARLSNWTTEMIITVFSHSVMSDSLRPHESARQASLSITNFRSSLRLAFIESVMSSNHLILCHPLLLLPSIFPIIRVFQTSQLFASGGQSIGVSASTSVLPMNTQDWSTLGWTGWISLQSKI